MPRPVPGLPRGSKRLGVASRELAIRCACPGAIYAAAAVDALVSGIELQLSQWTARLHMFQLAMVLLAHAGQRGDASLCRLPDRF
ncbi:hypothetical protein ACU4GD_28360 [Cupriavidus basilensis]